jgi:hypothetical protein
VIQDGQLVCDGCQKPITRITSAADPDWARMHNLCSACFLDLWKRSIPPA